MSNIEQFAKELSLYVAIYSGFGFFILSSEILLEGI